MNAKAIDYIIKRGRCICGCDLTKNQGAIENIEYEKSLLPPQHIGTMVRSFKETCSMIVSQCRSASLKTTILNDYSDIRRFQRGIGEIVDKLKIISDKIKEHGSVNVAQIENDNSANERDGKRQNAEFPAFGAKRAFQRVENLTFLDYYTVKEKVKESQSQI